MQFRASHYITQLKIFKFKMLIISLVLITCVLAEECFNSHFQKMGKCVPFIECKTAVELLKNKIVPEDCKYEYGKVHVCCVLDTKKIIKRKSDEYCEKINKKRTWKDDGDFYEFLSNLPAVEETTEEFAHVVALGYGTLHNIYWNCGGTLISNKFVLTAAHCLHSQQHGPVRFIQIGTTTITNNLDNIYLIHQSFIHGGYKPPSTYNDIALIELEESVDFSKSIKPACLHSQLMIPETYSIQAVVWGSYDTSNERLQSIDLQLFEQCNDTYASNKYLFQDGVIDSQICAGSYDGKDTCKGDSGGPLEYLDLEDVHRVIGITSVGKSCGYGVPGVYTRVYNYLEWIEETVWPSEFDINIRIL